MTSKRRAKSRKKPTKKPAKTIAKQNKAKQAMTSNKAYTKSKPVANVQGNKINNDRPRGGGGADTSFTSLPTPVVTSSPISRPSGMPDFLSYDNPTQNKIGFGVGQVDPKLAQAAGINQGIQNILPQNIPFITGGDDGTGGGDTGAGDTPTVVAPVETEEQKML